MLPEQTMAAVASGGRPLRITAFGTSLTALYDWPEALETHLSDCLDRAVRVEAIARPGASVAWGVGQSKAVTATRPDVVLMEFAINDADVIDGVRLGRSGPMTRELISALREEANSPPAVILMTMNPARGIRRWVRPRLEAHYDAYRDIAKQTDTGLVDLHSRWMVLPRAARGLEKDGLHPDAEVARDIVLGGLVPYLAKMVNGRCTN